MHITAPDKTGGGLARAATLALSDAGIGAADIDVVSAHATATPFNDAAEAKAMELALGDGGSKLVHPFKAQVGHTLGAAGILESLALLDGMRRGLGPAAAGEGALDPECNVRMANTNAALPCTASSQLVGVRRCQRRLGLRTAPARRASAARRPVFLQNFLTLKELYGARTLTDRLGERHPNLPRLDRLAARPVRRSRAVDRDRRSGHGGGGITPACARHPEQNELFDVRRRERGVRAVEPRRFPATSPNAAAGECAIAFRLTGPSFAVGGSLHGGLEALAVARDLIAAGDAETMLVVATDVAGVVSSELLRAAAGAALPEGACAAILGASPARQTPSGVKDDIEVPTQLPRTLGRDSDWIWAGPAGHLELERYLRSLAGC